MTPTKLLCCTLLPLLLLCARAGWAEPAAARILVLLDDQTRPVGARLRAELRALGFAVVLPRSAPPPSSRASLERAARAARAAAAVRVRPSPSGVEIWVSDRVTGKTVLRQVLVPQALADSDALIALRAVELLRASLLEVEQAHPSRGELPAPRQIEALVRKRSPPKRQEASHALLTLAPAIGLSPGGLGPSAHLRLGFAWRLNDQVPLSFEILTPTLPVRMDEVEGSASAAIGLLGVGVDFQLAPSSSPYNGRAGLGVAMLWMHLDGVAQPPFSGSTDDLLSALPYLRVGASRCLVGSLRLVLDTRVGFAAPRPVVRFAGREVAHWGRPAAVGSLGVELAID